MPAPLVQILAAGDYDRQIRRAADLLNGGGVVVLPTETVYGAAALLSNKAAISRLRRLDPPLQQGPLVVHLASPGQATRFLDSVSDLARRMIHKLWPGPVAITLAVPAERQNQVAAEFAIEPADLYHDGAITLRCPDHMVASDVLGLAAAPVVLRKSGGPEDSAQKADHAAELWGEAVDLILDAGPTRFSKPSTILRVNDHGYEIVRAGVYDQRIIERLLRTTILFVCSGNTCRSPMAEAIARQLVARKLSVAESDLEKRGLSILSAGSFAMPGARATPAAVDAAKDIGLDLSQHRSRTLTVELIHEADVIYTMGRSHYAAVTSLVPAAARKVVPLNPDGDIEDPIGGDLRLYQSLAGQLRELIGKRLEEQTLP